jgi:hypothetical protein
MMKEKNVNCLQEVVLKTIGEGKELGLSSRGVLEDRS